MKALPRTHLPLLPLALASLTPHLLPATLDENTNGRSDVWEQINDARRLPPDADTDRDGLPNAQEAALGTNPRDPDSHLFPKVTPGATPGTGVLEFPSAAGKRYQLKSTASIGTPAWAAGGNWIGDGTVLRPSISFGTSQGGFFLLEVSDADTDGDGLNDWEEHTLGFDPTTAYTQRDWSSDYDRARWSLRDDNTVRLSLMEDELEEGWPDEAVVALRRTGGYGRIEVTLTRGGTATAGGDYSTDLPASVTLRLEPGQRETWYRFQALQDTSPGEADETITVTLEAPAPTIIQGAPSVSITLRDPATHPLPSKRAAARFLAQATFGPSPAAIDAVMDQGYGPWIEDQIARANPGRVMPYVSRQNYYAPDHEDYVAQTPDFPNPDLLDTNDVRVGIWNRIMSLADPGSSPAESLAPSELRARTAFVLSEILVISTRHSDIGQHPEGAASYYDMLVDQAFGNYRDLLRGVALHPCMGLYLSHLQNRKADPTVGRFPDENFAREIMQLFSVGLWMLQPDGTPMLDDNGQPIPTYSNAEITALARVFTGLSWGRIILRDELDGSVVEVEENTNFDNWRGNDHTHPMRMFDRWHDFGEKQLLTYPGVPNGGVIPARTNNITLSGEGMRDVDEAIDILFNHPNVGPFLARRFIQFMVTSNPSPAYVGRVAAAFNSGRHAGLGSGRRGDLGALVRAVLLDPEARSPQQALTENHGKLHEPLLRLTRLTRAFDAYSEARFPYRMGWIRYGIGQEPLASPSVFNFFLPDHRPPGEMAAGNLYAPEFQMMNSTAAVRLPSYLLWSSYGLYEDEASPEYTLELDLGPEVALAEDADALLRHLDVILTGGLLRPEQFKYVRDAVERIDAGWDWVDDSWRHERVRTAIYLITNGPQGAILK